MDGPGFHVEPEVLDAAADGMVEVVADQDAAPLDTLPGSSERYGHGGAHGALVEFCTAWTIGMDALCDRGRRNATSLREVAQAYREADARTAHAFVDDPGSAVVEPAPTPPR